MPDEADPPRKNYGFREREFQRDNVLKPGAPSQPTARELAMMSGPVVRSKTDGAAKAGDPNDVYVVLGENRAVEKKLGLNEVEIREIKSRRKRDYWLLLISSELMLGTLAVAGRDNPIVFVSAVAGMGLVASGLTWLMWHVMGKY